jgi:hypothetical protein
MISNSRQLGFLILKRIVRTVSIIIILPGFILTAAYISAPIASGFMGRGGNLGGDFGFKLGMMVIGTWLILTFYYFIYCAVTNFIKRKTILRLIWILFLIGPPLYLTTTSRYDYSVNLYYFLFNSTYYIGHQILNNIQNRILRWATSSKREGLRVSKNC